MRRWELVLYLLLAMVGVLPAFGTNHVVGDGVDMFGTVWFFWWIEDCIRNLRDPSFTDLFFHPFGKDIFAHTGNNFVDALFAAPLVALFGPLNWTRAFVPLMLVGNALSFRVLAQGMLKSVPAVVVATVAWELNPYVLFEITCGRYTQAFLIFLPLALHFLIRCEEGTWKDAALAGTFVALQAYTYWFMGYFIAFGALGFVGVAIWRNRSSFWRYALAVLVCLILVAPAGVAMAAHGPVPGVEVAATKDIFAPPPKVGNNVGSVLHGYLVMEAHGVPMLRSVAWTPLALAWLFVGRERARILPGALLTVIMAVGTSVGTQVLPWYMAAYHYLPFFDRLWFPYRMVGVVFLLLALAIGTLVDRWPRALLIVPPLLVGSLVELSTYAVFPFVWRDLTPPATVQWIVEEKGGGVMHLPIGVTQTAIVWQTLHHQPLFGGMGENAEVFQPEGWQKRLKQPLVRAFRAAVRNPDREPGGVEPEDLAELKSWGIRWIILQRELVETELARSPWGRGKSQEELGEGAIKVSRLVVGLLGEPSGVDGRWLVWDLQGSAPPPELLGHDPYAHTWTPEAETAYEAALRERGKLGPER